MPNETEKPPADGISFILPNGKYITAHINNSPEVNRTIYAAFWTSWALYYRKGFSRLVRDRGNHAHHKK